MIHQVADRTLEHGAGGGFGQEAIVFNIMGQRMKLATACVMLAAVTTAHAEIVFHNGSDDPFLSDPLGNGDVNVGVIADDDLGFLEKNFYESATLELNYDFVAGQPPVSLNEFVFNVAGPAEDWTAFTITLELAAFFKLGEGGTGTALGGDITVGDVDLRHADERRRNDLVH